MSHPTATTRPTPLLLLILPLSGFASTTKPDASAAPADAAVTVTKGERLADLEDPRYKPTIPPKYEIPGKRYAGLFKVCVAADGRVSGVTVSETSGIPEIDEHWMKTIRTWPYRPFAVNGKPVPSCQPLRLEVKAEELAKPNQGLQWPRMIPPNRGKELRLGDIENDPRYKPRLPAKYQKAGARHWGLYKVCVSTEGHVTQVAAIKPPDSEVDEGWRAVLRTCPHRPFLVNGVPLPYCYPLRIEVKVSE